MPPGRPKEPAPRAFFVCDDQSLRLVVVTGRDHKKELFSPTLLGKNPITVQVFSSLVFLAQELHFASNLKCPDFMAS